jgi:hypothetical protein
MRISYFILETIGDREIELRFIIGKLSNLKRVRAYKYLNSKLLLNRTDNIISKFSTPNNSWPPQESIGGGIIQSSTSDHTTWPISNLSQNKSSGGGSAIL